MKYMPDMEENLKRAMEQRLTGERHRLALLGGRLHGASPLSKISNGYGFVTDAEGKRLSSISQAVPGEKISLRISDGRIRAQVIETIPYLKTLDFRQESSD